jgi:NADPH:quinone reductase-like Zn-dependent oxidoreductase/aryl carrier-like protein
VRAAGLNFRDVLQALGMMAESASADELGLECAGVVAACGDGVQGLAPGDEVIAIATGAFASEVVAQADLVAPKPFGLEFEEAATIPVAFVTARYVLHDLARIGAGDRVLVHTASGGVGLAAVQLCRRAGAEVLATAGTPAKRAFLASLGIEHVMDSRSSSWADEVLECTDGQGVDVVLNSLAGEARALGLGVLRTGGRFVELAVRDVLQDLPVRLRPFERGLAFFTLGDVASARRRELGNVLRTAAAEINAGTLEPLPHTDFDLADAASAFRLMAQAGHIGKVVLTLKEPTYTIEQPAPPLVRADATYLLTGGVGGFALAVAAWLTRNGARHVVLMSRSGRPRPEDVAALDALLRSPAEVRIFCGDVADAGQLDRVLSEVRETMPPLRGIVHAAMTLDDDLLGRLDQERLRAVLAPKIAGAWNLHQLTRQDELEHFVLFSSGSSLVGIPSQANYAAGNAFLDGLALHRRALGLPALAINWGAITGVGYVARNPDVQERLSWEGVGSISADEACAALEHALRHDAGRVAVARIDWSLWTDGTAPTASPQTPNVPRPADKSGSNEGRHAIKAALGSAAPEELAPLLESHLLHCAATVLDANPDRLDPERPLTAMGLDSLMAVELQTAVRRDLGAELPLVEVLDGMTLRQLTERLLEPVTA